jgi:Na+-transporting NADH:ubiquinone oxidoreductase subunit NqrB
MNNFKSSIIHSIHTDFNINKLAVFKLLADFSTANWSSFPCYWALSVLNFIAGILYSSSNSSSLRIINKGYFVNESLVKQIFFDIMILIKVRHPLYHNRKSSLSFLHLQA